MKIVWFVVGGSFFLCWPIASRYPKYRYLVSPIKWVLWDIPTHAEWSFQYLRKQTQISREMMIRQKVERGYVDEATMPKTDVYSGNLNIPKIRQIGPDDTDAGDDDSEGEDWQSVSSANSVLNEDDIMSFRCLWDNIPGRFVIYSGGIKFVRSLRRKELWKHSFMHLVEMKKLSGSNVGKLLEMGQLEFRLLDGDTLRIGGTSDRDEIFNCIIGFSNLQWQALQYGDDEKKKEDESKSD